MTRDQVINIITKTHKWYVYIGWSQQRGFSAIKQYRAGKLSEKKLHELFDRCGFIMDTPATYKETEFPPVRFRV